ncbi:C6 finger domain protein [Aspergillus phoenicis ATCC 13157]|uniref:C6 finger domain protein n=2 Tax=Aspergillus TaxID=5052 RepID=A0A370PLU9_ASPPH|nr:C6 finger domain protein [Aspergillus phoenicis ATCC 13157]
MVFCGKPSKGCGECRSRKIRCDQTRPTCSQCAKGNRVCPGYRDQLSLMFRDESQQVIRKARTGTTARRAKSSRKTSPGSTTNTTTTTSSSNSSAPASSPSGSGIVTASPSPGPVLSSADSNPSSTTGDLEPFEFDGPEYLSPQFVQQHAIQQPLVLQPSYQPTKNEAISYFLRQNAWIGSFWSKIEANPDILRRASATSHNALMTSLASVGIAMISRIRKSEPMKIAAEKEYGNALQLLTTAVADQQQAKNNATLAAVLMLAIFEVITSRGSRFITNWTNHITGAAALLELRGVEQLQDPDGLQLFLQLRYQIIISCLQREAHVPDSVLHCVKVAMFLRPHTVAYGDRLLNIMGRLANLRADIKEKIITDRKKMLESAYAVEAELMSWLTSLPDNFPYATIQDPWPTLNWGPKPYNNIYHVYTDFWICNSWNQYRVARIIISDLILTCIRELNAGSPLPADLVTHTSQIRNTARQLASDVCASVPYYFTDSVFKLATGQAEMSSRYEIPSQQGFVRGLVLLWPLAMAAATRGLNHPLRRWVLDCLQLIGHGMGIDQALALIELLMTEDGVFDTLALPEDDSLSIGSTGANFSTDNSGKHWTGASLSTYTTQVE